MSKSGRARRPPIVEHPPYARFAEIYDEVMQDVPYSDWVRYALGWVGDLYHQRGVASAARAPSPQPGGRWHILDLACGTGRVAAELVRLGHRVTGVDRSAAMLEVARRRVPAATYIQGDLRRFRAPDRADAALCLYDSLNYLPDATALRRAFANVARALVPGGVFVFDLNSPARLASIPTGIVRYDGANYTLFWSNRYRADRRACEVRLVAYQAEPGAPGRVRRWRERHVEFAHEPEDVLAALRAAGFRADGPFHHGTRRRARHALGRLAFVAVAPGARL